MTARGTDRIHDSMLACLFLNGMAQGRDGRFIIRAATAIGAEFVNAHVLLEFANGHEISCSQDSFEIGKDVLRELSKTRFATG